MKKITIIMIIVFIFSSCSFSFTNDSKKNTEIYSDSNILYFEKKKECLSYKSQIEEIIKNISVNQGNDIYVYEEILIDLFYSPLKNTCIYSTKTIETFTQNYGLFSEGECIFYRFFDFFSIDYRYKIGDTIKGENIKLDNGLMVCDNSLTYESYMEEVNSLK